MFNTFGKTLLACASLSVIAATGGMAQTATAAARIPDEGTRIAFEIPAQSVSQSLQMFARQSGYRILFSEESVRSLRASAVTGSLSPRAALDRILAGTRLEVASVNGKVIALGERKTAAAGARRAPPATRMAPQSESAPVASGDTLAAAEPAAAAEIVVTGTLIRNPALTSATPVQSTGAEEIQLRQANTAEELLRELPGVVPSLGSAVNIGNPGYSFVDLRGLGSNRNVVLLDGQRIAPADLYGRVDLNNIPLALIERVDNLTGGASTTYGADAVSGVVNFVTRKDFEGVEINVSDQITSRGDGNYFNADITAGHNFADGRGNIVLSYGYQNANPVYQGDRSFGEVAIDSFSGGVSGSGTTTPARFTLLGQNGGNVQVNPATGGFNEGYTPFNFAPYNLFQLPFERHNVFGAAHYEVADGIELYGRGLYSKNTSTTIVAASGVSGSVVSIPLSNPFLGDGQRSVFCADAGMTSVQCGAAAVATDPNDPNFRAVDQQLWYRSVGLGPRVDEYQTELYDLRAGLRGALTDTINFDVSGSYGESMNKHIQDEGFMSLSATRDALMATSTGACLSGNPGCVPINIFGGPEALTPEMAEYVTVRPYSETKASLLQFQGQLDGDFGVTSPFASDPIAFAAGASYRKYKASQDGNEAKTTPGEVGLDASIMPFSGGYHVVEGFGEIIAPLASDRPFLESLTFEAGLRYSRYSIDSEEGRSFGTTTYKMGGNWEPVMGLKLRGMYQHAVRAPNIYELFQPASAGFGNLQTDPCAGAAPLNNSALAAVCMAQGAPAGRLGNIVTPQAGEINTTISGNLDLSPETADSFTLGVVLQPLAVPGLTITADYFNIRIKDAIASMSSFDAIEACFGDVTDASATNPACLAIRRNPNTGGLSGDQSVTPGLALPLTNAGRLKTDGIDLNVTYRRDVGPGTLTLNFAGTWTSRSQFQSGPSAAVRECVGYYSANCGTPAAPEVGSLQPEYVWNQRVSYNWDPVMLSLLWRHTSSMRYEPAAEASTGPAYAADGVDFGRIGAANYFDLTARVDVTEQLQFTLAVQNLADKTPPFVGSSIGSYFFNSGNTFPSTYDPLGRRFSAAVKMKF